MAARVLGGAVRPVAMLTIGASVVALLSVLPANATPRPNTTSPQQGVRLTHSTIHWGRCADSDLRMFGAQCAMLRVPLDYSHPKGATIRLALARLRHTVPAAQFQGVMLTNPGGPGGSGRYLATLGFSVPHGVGDTYDWIGIDPRGVGASRPAISCDDSYFHFARPNYNPARGADLRAWLTRSKKYALACGKRNGSILRHMTTADSARDMERIRIALGAAQINYYGYSYGTYLGQVYATLHPSRVRRMVLDSNVDPRLVWYRANLDQNIAFQRNTVTWFSWLAKHNNLFHLGRTEHSVAKLWYTIRTRLGAHADHRLGPAEWTDVFLNAAYYQQTWEDLAWLFADYVHHHAITAVKQAYVAASGIGDDNEFAAYNAVQCTDVQWPTSWRIWARDNTRVNKRAPFETWANAWFNAPCRYWPAAAHQPVRVDGRKVPSALLVGETLDAATPYTGSLEVRRRFPHARLIALPGGTTHANSLNGDACLDGKIAEYLKNGTLPARHRGNHADAICKPLPVPRP